MVTESADIERNSDNVELCSKMIEDCSHCVRESRNLPEVLPTDQSPTRRRFAGAPAARQTIDSEHECHPKATAPN
jgi:hypothetical protein